LNPSACGDYTSPSGKVWITSGIYQDTIVIMTINLNVTHTDTVVTQAGKELHANSDSSYTYQWLDCTNENSPILGVTDSIFISAQNGAYAVQIENKNCLDFFL
jgi:hypothetical protein